MSIAVSALRKGPGLAQALAALNRETTSSEDRRFRWLQRSVWCALLLLPSWVVLARWLPTIQRRFLVAALVCIATSVGLLLMNVPFLARTFRAWLMARKLGLSRRLNVQRTGTGVMQMIYGWCLFGLHVFGWLIASIGSALVASAIPAADYEMMFQTSVISGFGLACIVIYPMTRMRWRLDAIGTLKVALANQPIGSESTDLPPGTRDDVTNIERIQIEIDRERCVDTRRTNRTPEIAVRLTEPFQEATMALPLEEAAQVFRVVHGLLKRSEAHEPFRASDRDTAFALVPATPFEVEFCRDRDRHEIRILGLQVRRMEPLSGSADA